jgi:hypothetical protein
MSALNPFLRLWGIFVGTVGIIAVILQLTAFLTVWYACGDWMFAGVIYVPLGLIFGLLARFVHPLFASLVCIPLSLLFITSMPRQEAAHVEFVQWINDNNAALYLLQDCPPMHAQGYKDHEQRVVIMNTFWQNVGTAWENSQQSHYWFQVNVPVAAVVQDVKAETEGWFLEHHYPQDGNPPVPTPQYISDYVAKRAGHTPHPPEFFDPSLRKPATAKVK